MNFLTRIIGFFQPKKSPQQIRDQHIVVLDGDQYTSAKLINMVCVPMDKTEYLWVSSIKSAIPKVLKSKEHIRIVRATAYGKECTDTHIAMMLTRMCGIDPTIKKVSILSNDSDFIDMLIFLGSEFPDIQFVLGVNTDGPSFRPTPKNPKFPVNCSRIIFRGKK